MRALATTRAVAPVLLPQSDPDHDGILTAVDHCPTVAEDMDHIADTDGCPEVDQDCDSVADVSDRCPEQAEDRDGFEDSDGCPDLDNDGDHLVDRCDQCPNEQEIINEVEDDDGCPDIGPLVLLPAEVRIPDPLTIMFDRETATMFGSQNASSLDGMVALLRRYSSIEEFALVGHADFGEESPRGLSLARATNVLQGLNFRGVELSRLVAHGVGTASPLVARRRPINERARNQRVEVFVVRFNGHVYRRWNGRRYIDLPRPPAAPVAPPPPPVESAPVCPPEIVIEHRPGGCRLPERVRG